MPHGGEASGSASARFSIAPSGLRVIIHQADQQVPPAESAAGVTEAAVSAKSSPGTAPVPLAVLQQRPVVSVGPAEASYDPYSGVADTSPPLVVPAPLPSTRARRIVFFREAAPAQAAAADGAAEVARATTTDASLDAALTSRDLSLLSLDESARGAGLAAAVSGESFLSSSDETGSPSRRDGGAGGAGQSGAVSAASSGSFAIGVSVGTAPTAEGDARPPPGSAAAAAAAPTEAPLLSSPQRRAGGAGGIGFSAGLVRSASSDSLSSTLLSPTSAVGPSALDSPRALPPLPLQRSNSARFGGVAMLTTATGDLVAPSRRNVVAPALARSLSDRDMDLGGRSHNQQQQQDSSRTQSVTSANSAR